MQCVGKLWDFSAMGNCGCQMFTEVPKAIKETLVMSPAYRHNSRLRISPIHALLEAVFWGNTALYLPFSLGAHH